MGRWRRASSPFCLIIDQLRKARRDNPRDDQRLLVASCCWPARDRGRYAREERLTRTPVVGGPLLDALAERHRFQVVGPGAATGRADAGLRGALAGGIGAEQQQLPRRVYPNRQSGSGRAWLLQIQHWNWDGAVNWRIPLSTDYTIRGATLTVAMSKPGGAWVYTSNQGLVDFMTARPVFTSPKVYVWGVAPEPVDNGDGTWTFQLGDLAAGTGIVFAFRAPLDPDLTRIFHACSQRRAQRGIAARI